MKLRISGCILLSLALLSVADRTGACWLVVRALMFLWCGVAASSAGKRLPYALGFALGAIAWAEYAGLDWAVGGIMFGLLRARMRDLAVVCGTVGVVGGLSFAYSLWQPGWQPAFLPFHNRNHYAVFCELSLPLLVYQFRRKREPLYLAAGLVMLLTALAGGSRAGAVLLLVEVCALWLMVTGKQRAWAIAPAIGVAASLFLVTAGWDRIAKPFEGDHRLEIWRSGIDMLWARPIAGWGAGQFPRVYPEFARFDNGQFVNAAHSDWLEWLVEYGIAAGAVLIGMFLWWMRKTIHFDPSWGILVSALHAMVDFPFHLPGLLVFAAALAGSIEANGIRTKTKSGNRKGRNSRVPSTGRAGGLSRRAGHVADGPIGVVGLGSGSGLQEVCDGGEDQRREDALVLRAGTDGRNDGSG
ncbi:MAG: O-antigen ligase family protein [Acidobacteria bacterium]|nr:O-antigen ligase family protein [Acidobacteriota bacterium]